MNFTNDDEAAALETDSAYWNAYEDYHAQEAEEAALREYEQAKDTYFADWCDDNGITDPTPEDEERWAEEYVDGLIAYAEAMAEG